MDAEERVITTLQDRISALQIENAALSEENAFEEEPDEQAQRKEFCNVTYSASRFFNLPQSTVDECVQDFANFDKFFGKVIPGWFSDMAGKGDCLKGQ